MGPSSELGARSVWLLCFVDFVDFVDFVVDGYFSKRSREDDRRISLTPMMILRKGGRLCSNP